MFAVKHACALMLDESVLCNMMLNNTLRTHARAHVVERLGQGGQFFLNQNLLGKCNVNWGLHCKYTNTCGYEIQMNQVNSVINLISHFMPFTKLCVYPKVVKARPF